MNILRKIRFHEYANASDILKLIKRFNDPRRHIKILNVCGSHEHTVCESGLRSILPDNIELVPGPGCPVCVTSQRDIASAILLSKEYGAVILTYGDMLRVPTSVGSIKSSGCEYHIITAPHEALDFALKHPEKKVVFFSIGFETTTAPFCSIFELGIPDNLYVLCSHKLTTAAMRILIETEDVQVDAFVAPGHVSTVVGSDAWSMFPETYRIPVVVAGFTPEDILMAIGVILYQLVSGEIYVENVYRGVVRKEGNTRAKEMVERYLKIAAVEWRGLGWVPDSGYKIKDEYRKYDVYYNFNIPEFEIHEPEGCICSDIILGRRYPSDCTLFHEVCKPSSPVGPCMVSPEGACNIWYRYNVYA